MPFSRSCSFVITVGDNTRCTSRPSSSAMNAQRPSTVLATFLFIRRCSSEIVIDQQCDKQCDQIDNGITKRLHRSLWPLGHQQVDRVIHETTTQRERSRKINHSAH